MPKDLKVFHDVARALTSSLDLDSILGAIMQQMEQFFEPESWSLLIVDEEQQNLYYAVAAGKSSGDRNLRVDMGEGIAGWVAQHGEPLIVSEPGNDPRFSYARWRRSPRCDPPSAYPCAREIAPWASSSCSTIAPPR